MKHIDVTLLDNEYKMLMDILEHANCDAEEGHTLASLITQLRLN